MRHPLAPCALLLVLPAVLPAQVAGRFPPESLVNVQVIPRTTPVINVVGIMRDVTSALGVRCQFCHLGEEGLPLERFDFASDERRTKRVARQMMRMVQEINRRLDTIPERPAPGVEVTCTTCHRGTTRPMPLFARIVEVTLAAGADSAIRTYRALREGYYGSDAYDFTEPSLNIAAFRLARQRRFDEAFALLRLNEEQFPGAPYMYVVRGNINLLRGDTAAAVAAFQEAVRRNDQGEARMRLRQLGRQP